MFFSQWDRVISRCVKQRKSILIAWNGRRFWNVCSDPLSIITVIQQMRCIFLKEKYRASHHSFPLEVRTQTTKSNRRNGKLSVVFFFSLFISLHQVLLQLSGSVAFISLFAEPWSCASASSSRPSGHVDIKPGKLIPNTESLQRLFPMARVPFPVLIQPPPVFPRKPPGSTSLSLL